MHAGVWTDFYEKFKNSFEEGEVYIIDNFNVKPYKSGSYRCIDYDKQIWLSSHTNVRHVDNDDEVIPNHHFDFNCTTEIPKIYSNPDRRNLLIGILFMCILIFV